MGHRGVGLANMAHARSKVFQNTPLVLAHACSKVIQKDAAGAATRSGYLKAAARMFRSLPKARSPTFYLVRRYLGSNLAIIPSPFVSRSLHEDEESFASPAVATTSVDASVTPTAAERSAAWDSGESWDNNQDKQWQRTKRSRAIEKRCFCNVIVAAGNYRRLDVITAVIKSWHSRHAVKQILIQVGKAMKHPWSHTLLGQSL